MFREIAEFMANVIIKAGVKGFIKDLISMFRTEVLKWLASMLSRMSKRIKESFRRLLRRRTQETDQK